MDTVQFENLAKEITGLNIKVYEPVDPGCKYTSYVKFNGILEPSKKYGIYFEESIQYDFKTTKKIETFFKSFINQHISKYEMKLPKYEFIEGKVVAIYPKKQDVIKKYTSNRVSKYHYYTTLYGIGMFAFFTKDIAIATAKLAKYLKDNNISYSNEYSDAGWAYRFVIGKKVEEHNDLLKNFVIC
tara:strand:+ start:360 stop:914 length:555 start_codon:yes stop_codon:yes gene_type:complete